MTPEDYFARWIVFFVGFYLAGGTIAAAVLFLVVRAAIRSALKGRTVVARAE